MHFKSSSKKNDQALAYRHKLLNDVLGIFSIASGVNLAFTLYQAS